MLDTQTKKRINDARDVLVGVVPHPQAQIEQITTALIYKFMDDMDRENEEIGRQATFLTGELAPFAWGKLMSRQHSGDARWELYTGALENFAKAQQIPVFFRTIFKDAYLPYRDSRVLNLFLTEINGFSYEHSEKLGDAFEYLLSISGAQADAGQFRTPRHIIDFIVEIINPQKFERILDPACGTAGFLISTYKHIIKHNSSNFDPDKSSLPFVQQGENAYDLSIQNNGYKGDKLTSDERGTLANNIHGYDVAPEMVRLSLVNLYLHGFISPQISNYDTLTYDTNWNDDYDVMLANPPFMTPKGGIRPHNRFSVKANRAEVLFVDYIAEHLSITGRAGIIVPEGIIFQAANAYKQLRKNLIENWGLYAVISLPAGIFQPYSGVKTSILLLDKTQRKNPNILFINIKNDGFDLGAKRQTITKNDLPQAFDAIKHYQKTGQSKDSDNDLALIVEKSKIADDGDYNLSVNRYKEVVDYSNVKWDMVALGDVCEILDNKRKPVKKSDRKQGKYPYYGATGILDYIDSYIFSERLVLIGEDGAKWGIGDKTAFIANDKYWVNNHAHVLRPNKCKPLDTLLVEIINSIDLTPHITGVTVPKLNQAKLKQIKIPLPPLKIQQQIVAEIEAYQKVIDGAKQVIKHYKPTLKINPYWDMVALGDVAKVISGQSPEGKFYNQNQEGLPFYQGKTEFTEMFIGEPKKWTSKTTKMAENGDILMSVRAPVGPVNIATQQICIGRGIASIRPKKIEQIFLFYFLKASEDKIKGNGGAVFDSINRKQIEQIKIPLPPLKIQQQIVAEIEAEQTAINECKKLITTHEQKIKAKIDEVWRIKGIKNES